MKYDHFIQPSPPTIVKLKSLYGVLRVNFSHKIGPIPFWLAPLLPSPINMTNMIRHYNSVSPYC